MKQGLPDLETAIAKIDLLDHRSVDWRRVQRTAYVIHQHLRYEYPGPIDDLRQRLVIIPQEQYGDQRRVDYRFETSASDAEVSHQDDVFGNREITLFVPRVEHAIDYETWILLERSAEKRSHYVSSSWLTDRRLLEPSALTQPDDALVRTAAMLGGDGKADLALAQHINEWVYTNICYAHNVTDIHTTAAEVLALGQGVCQDYAHLMVALCRLCGLPARYVSGHLLGEGGTHAWVEVFVSTADQPDRLLVVPFDPTHGCQVGLSYVTISAGCDYFDVAPTSGTFRAAHHGLLSARKRVALSLLEYAQ